MNVKRLASFKLFYQPRAGENVMRFMKWARLGAIISAIVGTAVFYPHTAAATVKNVIFVIGDGMGFQQLGLLNAYAKYAPNSIYKDKNDKTAIEQAIADGTIGIAYHEAANVLVTDSAASATQFATGKRAGSEMIGCDQFGDWAETILEIAKKKGKSTGLVSDTRITHATPAAFAAHQSHRSKENAIAVDLLDNEVDVMLSGGLRHFIPNTANNKQSAIYQQLKTRTGGQIKIKSKRKDSRNLLDEAERQSYVLAFTQAQLQQAKGAKILGLFAYSGMLDGIQETLTKNDPKRTVPTLAEMTSKALEILSKNDQGFFLMVEAGQIDWAGHNNDAGTLLHEMIKLDNTVQVIQNWAEDRHDTLIIISADHETGGFGFSYSRNALPKPIDLPGFLFKEDKFKPNFNFGRYDILDKLYQQQLSYPNIFRKFEALPEPQKTPEKLAEMVNKYTAFPITATEAATVLEVERNEYRVPGHKSLDAQYLPKIHDFKEFYVYPHRMRDNLLARVVGKYQNTVWATGTHTNTPVPLIALGPNNVTAQFGQLLHTTEWGQLAIDALQ
jgi:alkaline phosphatase